MALIDENYLKDTFNIHKDVKSARMTPYIARAARRLKKWVGTATYETSDPDIKSDLKLAEATLAMSYLIRNLNTAIRVQGLVLVEEVEDGVRLSYQNPTQTAQTEAAYFQDAENIVRDLMEACDLPAVAEFIETDINYENDYDAYKFTEWQT